MTKKIWIVFLLAWIVAGQQSANAAPVPEGQDIGSKTRAEAKEEERKKLLEKLSNEKKDKVKIEGQEEVKPKIPSEKPMAVGSKVFIREIVITGNTLIQNEPLQKVVAQYKEKELSLADFQAVVSAITDAYRAEGYVTSFAYMPPQKIENKTLQVAVRENKVGQVKVSGNKWFGTNFLARYIDLKKGDFFNYDNLRKNIRHMNETPDLNSQVVLSRGEEPNETDVNINVKDRLPFHVTAGYNNYNSHFLERNKYSLELKSTNFLGRGDMLSAEAQLGESDQFQLYSTRYLTSITPRLSAGGYYIHVEQELGRSLEDSHITGEGDVVRAYLSYKLFDEDDFSMSVSPALEHKDFLNESNGVPVGEDNVRLAKLGFDFDWNNVFGGRNLLTQEFDFGIPNIFGGMSSRSASSSRAGAAGDFIRFVTNAARVQKMPWATVLLLKGSMQLSNYTIPSSEQFQIGGFYTVRGYPVSEYAGDSGGNLSAEWYFPPYFLPKNLKVPFTDKTYHDALTFFPFFDYGYISNNSPRPGETKNESLYSTGLGLRFNLTNQLSVSFDYGFALGQKASDGANSHGYIETKLFF